MFTSGEKTNTTVNNPQSKAAGSTFFRKTGDTNFFGASETPSFFKGKVQAKLTVSQSNDPQEKEADEMAEHVMRMADPAVAPAEKKEEELQRMEEKAQAGSEAPTIEIHRKEENEKEVQAKLFHHVHRYEDDGPVSAKLNSNPGSITGYNNPGNNISLYQSDIIQCSGRGPPGDSIQFEQSLSSSKGSGSVLPDNTKTFMESRFQADFSGVRVHTGSHAENLSETINAQAFAYGNDIYFNSGKFNPSTTDGNVLLAHELTHTIQQGASKPVPSSQNSGSETSVSAKPISISRKEIIPSGVDNIPPETLQTNFTPDARDKKNDPLSKKSKSSGPDKLSLNNKSGTFGELPNEPFDISRKQENDGENALNQNEKDGIQLKTELSTWQVNAQGHLKTGHASTVNISNDNKLQPKEEKKEEEEKQSLVNQNVVQKKHVDEIQGKCDKCTNEEATGKSGQAIQKKTEITGDSPGYESDGSASVISNEKDRGPPANNLIQRSWLGDAWGAVSGLAGEVGKLVEQGINAAKGWLMDKLVAFVEVIPGYKLARYILGHDPVSGKPVDKTPVNLLTAVIELVPVAGTFIRSVLDYFNATQPVADWLFGAVGKFISLIQGIGTQFEAVWNNITLDSIKDPEKIINQVANLFHDTITSIFNFAVECGSTFLTMVKDIAITNVVNFVQKYFPNAFDMLCVVLGENPISKQRVERNGTNIMNAGLKILGEEGAQIKEQMMANGIFQKCVAWIDRAISVITTSVAEVKEAFTSLWKTITFESLFHPIDTFNLIVDKFEKPVTRVKDFIKDAVIALLKILRDALLSKLSAYAKETKGYYLLTVLIGKDPFTGDQVDFNVENLIHGFMMLMDGGEEHFQEMKKSGAIDRASQQITAAVKKLNFTWPYIKGLFTSLWESLGWKDFLNIFGVFAKIVHTFGQPILRLIAFIIEIIKIVIHVILEIMNFPFDLINNIIAKAIQAFELIKKDPIGFLKNLLRAIKQGFVQFFGNILTHLIKGLKAWFLSEVQAAGIPIPKDFTVMGIIKWLLEVLGITMEKIWKKLEERIGKPKVDKIKKMIDTAQRVAGAAGDALAFMEDVQKRGFMAVMIDKVKEQLSNVWELVLDAVKSFVMDQIIKKMTAKLLSMLDPTGIMAVINSAIALYKAIQSFIRYLRQMLEIVNSFVEGTLQIAQGATKNAADFLEGALARGIPIVIGFFANQVGLNLSERLKDALELVREKVDKGLTWVIDKVVVIIEKIVSFGKAVAGKVLSWLGIRKEFTMENGDKHTLALAKSGSKAQLMMESTPMPLLTFISQFAAQPGLPADKIKAADEAKTFATTQVSPLLEQLTAAPEGTDISALEKQVLDKMVELTNKIRLLVGKIELLGDEVNKYLLEGAAGTFASIPKPTRDDLTADHIPQNALFQLVMELGIFDAGSPMAKHAENRTDAGYAMNEQDKRHKAGRTWGPKGTVTKAGFRTRANTIIATQPTPAAKKNAIVEAIKTDKNDDISTLKTVYGKDIDDPVWKDVKDLPLKQEDKIALQNTIRAQADAGLSLLNSQNLDALKV
ncbi:MAG: DUF4157 domain-containing protein [Ginsengibacter sp.]